MDKKETITKIQEAKKNSKKRKFEQSIEISINFKNVNLQDSANKLNLSVVLPKGRGKDIKIGVFADGDMNLKAKKLSKFVLDKNELQEYAKNKRKMRTFARSCYAFVAQPDLMGTIGKSWGVVLAPRGKMPTPVPPKADLKTVFDKIRNTIRIKSKKNPTVNVPVGMEGMEDADIAENISEVMNSVGKKIPKEYIQSVYVKTTMGPAVKLW